ncbi:MAG: sensor histidine kinase [Pseudohongiellaceae bacterium]
MRQNPAQLISRRPFWVFQILGWSAWVLMLILRDVIFVPPEYLFPRALIFSASAAAGIVLTWGLRSLYRLVWEQGLIVRFAMVWLGSLAVAMIWQAFRNYIALLPFGETIDLTTTSAEDLLDGTFFSAYPLMLTWSALYFIFKYNRLFQAEKDKSLRSEALAHEAQLLMLRYQLNPHFLFNTLNAISTLVMAQANDKANEMLTKLSKFLRYSLDHSPLDRVSLTHELATSRLYLDIEEVRFGDRLQLRFDIDPDVQSALVPTMLLQPIIENSIKHGISKVEAGGTIAICAHREGEQLIIEVSDDGPGISAEETPGKEFFLSTGVGVSNIRNRLQEIYGDDHQLEFLRTDPHGLTVKVVIPYEPE